jgi:predicted transcriptional regulator
LVVAEDLMRSDVRPLTPDDTLDRALELFVENDVMALPIVADLQRREVVGMIRRQEIASAYLRHVHGTGAQEADRKMESKNMEDGGNTNWH